MKTRKLTGIVAKRKELATKVNNIAIKVSPHDRYVKIREAKLGYIVCPCTSVVDLTVEIRYTVLQVLPIGCTPFGIVEHMFDEWGRPQFAGAARNNWMTQNTLKCVYRGEMRHLTHIGPVMADREDAIAWSCECAQQLILNNEIARKKMVTHLLGIKKILADEEA